VREKQYQLVASSRSGATEVWRALSLKEGEAPFVQTQYLKSGRTVVLGDDGIPDCLTVRYRDGEMATWPVLRVGEEIILPAQR